MSAAATAAGEGPRRRRADSPAAVVQASGLPRTLGGLVLGVTGKCRLWERERIEVARELCAHFLDGLEAGASEDELAESFGDPANAARLITQAAKRKRPLWWRASRASLRGTGAFLLVCVVLYAVLAARFFLASPSIKRNYMAEMNAPVLATAADERAWPLYLRAGREFGPLPEFMLKGEGEPRTPGDESWREMAAWLDEHQGAMATVREAAARPVLGYVYRSTLDPDFADMLAARAPGYVHDGSLEREVENPLMVGVLLPHLGEMRRYARWLDADAALAAERGDGARFMADIEAMLGMGEQCLSERFLISTLVGIAIQNLATRAVLEQIERPGLLGDGQLRDLAHRLAGFAGGRVRIDASGERITIEDILQRFYSDDGRGDGRFVGGGGVMEAVYEDFGVARPRAAPLFKAIQPVQSVILPSRAELSARTEQFVGAASVDDALPPWRHDERSSDREYRKLMQSGVYTLLPILQSLEGGVTTEGSIATACAARDVGEARRDAVLTVIALELHRRETGDWPRRLEEIVPSFMPRMPLDPFDGRPLRYRLGADGKPVLYSVGVDGVDDGGAAPTTRAGQFGVRHLYWQSALRQKRSVTGAEQLQMNAARGDWLLWPKPPEPTEDGPPISGRGAN